MEEKKLKKIAQLIRYYIIVSTTSAGSGHPTSSLSATDVMTGITFSGIFRADIENPDNPTNDRLIFSKGHASPLFYALYGVAGKLTEKQLLSLRKFDSPLEGHPTMRFPYTEASTGSLGQGLSIGLGMALSAKSSNLPYRVFVLMGDSEMAEGSIWEAIQIASHYKLNNLIGIIDANRLGQRGETLIGRNTSKIARQIESFGWQTITIDGHNWKDIISLKKKIIANQSNNQPLMIIAKTIKGKGVSFLEDKNGWHGKTLNENEARLALKEIGEVDKKIKVAFASAPPVLNNMNLNRRKLASIKVVPNYHSREIVATRKAFGSGLAKLAMRDKRVVALDAEVGNSTFSINVEEKIPKQFYEMFIAEQNMVGVALGFSRRGKIPFVSTFSAFLTRAFDQIRMSRYSSGNIKFVGSHAGVSIGQDGASQMGLEDIAMFRAIPNCVVVYPSDAVSCEKLVEEVYNYYGISYLRTTRADTPILYSNNEKFPIGESKVLKQSKKDIITIISAGITLFEALKAYTKLKKLGIISRIIDLYSIKPLDVSTLQQALSDTGVLLSVEDHYPQGGIGEAIASALSTKKGRVYSLAVNKVPRSGSPQELLNWEEISADAITKKVKQILSNEVI